MKFSENEIKEFIDNIPNKIHIISINPYEIKFYYLNNIIYFDRNDILVTEEINEID